MRNYIDEIAQACQDMGNNVLVVDVLEKQSDHVLEEALREISFDMMFTMNAVGLDNTYIRKRVPLTCTYLCDHPAAHAKRLQNADDHTIVFVCDREHERYIHTYMKHITYCKFIPLSGSRTNQLKAFSDRKNEIVFTGSYNKPEPFRKECLEELPDSLAAFAEYMFQQVKESPELSLEGLLKLALQHFEVQVSEEEFSQLMTDFLFVDAYARRYYRDLGIRKLIEAEIPVRVYGNGWEDFVPKTKYLQIESGNEYIARKAVADAKIALNFMPYFKEGFQERIATAMLSGTVAVTDGSVYISEHFENGRDLCWFSLKNMDELPALVKGLLADEQRAGEIAENGRRIAEQELTWYHRTIEMLAYIRQVTGDSEILGENAGEQFEICLEQPEYERELTLDYIKRLEELDKLICQMLDYGDISGVDYLELKNRLIQNLYWMSKTAIENADYGQYVLKKLDEETTQGNCNEMTELLLLECRNVLEQLYVRENAYLTQTVEVLQKTSKNLNMQVAQAEHAKMEVLCKQILKKYEEDTSDEMQEILKNIRTQGYVDAYNFDFVQEYMKRTPQSYGQIIFDEEAGMNYMLVDGKRVYYPSDYNSQGVFWSYRFICIEQDKRSPHRYLDDTCKVNEGDVVIDAGVAEGNFSLAVVEKVKKLYLIECEHKWVEALKKTFEPWKDKVVIIEKMLGSVDDDTHVSIDGLLMGEEVNFIKMDIEGAELDALEGAKNTLTKNNDLTLAVCAYHRHNAEREIRRIFTENKMEISNSQGYMFFKEDMDSWVYSELRRGLIRGIKRK